jgi:hypothetical protein
MASGAGPSNAGGAGGSGGGAGGSGGGDDGPAFPRVSLPTQRSYLELNADERKFMEIMPFVVSEIELALSTAIMRMSGGGPMMQRPPVPMPREYSALLFDDFRESIVRFILWIVACGQ